MPVVKATNAGDRGTLWSVFVDGPDLIDRSEPASRLETILPWPLRLVIVAATVLAAAFWRNTGVGQQIAWGLHIGAVSATALVLSCAWVVMAVDLVIACLWLFPRKPPPPGTMKWIYLHVVTFLNREVGHLVAFFVWLVVSVAFTLRLPVQLGIFTSAVLLGPPLLNGMARTRAFNWLSPDVVVEKRGDLLWRRRLLIYLATLVGQFAIVRLGRDQLCGVAPFIFALVPGLMVRTLRQVLRNRALEKEQSTKSVGDLAARASFRDEQAAVAGRVDPFVPVLVVAALGVMVGFSWWQRQKLEAEHAASLDGTPTSPVVGCQRDGGGPKEGEVSLFIVADTQIHELSGDRYPGQAEIARSFVKGSARPVPLDMLASASLARFASMYRELSAARKTADRPPLLWAHLGDLADVSCKDELKHALTGLEAFDKSAMAGIAIGNHETTFEGTYHWSPYWTPLCPSGRLEKSDAVASLNATYPSLDTSGGVLTHVTKLGAVGPSAHERDVVGVFIDTSDDGAFDWGLPGSVGAVSEGQLKAVNTAITALSSVNPVYVLFMHHPFGALAAPSAKRLAGFIATLDKGTPRVLALMSAHTHAAAAHRHCIGRVVREITVGSTTDAPQQAALVDIGLDSSNRIALRTQTLHSVRRPAAMCGAPTTSMPSCLSATKRLVDAQECHALLGSGPDAPPGRACAAVEKTQSLPRRLAALRGYDGPRDIGEKKRADERQARQLLACICRDHRCAPPTEDGSPFGAYVYEDLVRAASQTPERSDEVVCLAWAASAVHEHAGMTMGEALACGFDDPTIPAERVFTATLEEAPCY